MIDDVFSYIDLQADEYIERLRAFCRQPSIAAQNLGTEEAGRMVVDMLEAVGAETQVIPTAGQPVIFAQVAGEGDKTLSFYNHYDVQPADPIELWESDPFAAEVRNGRCYARGVADNKGDLVARICAVEAYQAVAGRLPLNVKFIVEGEEEIGSPNLDAFAEDYGQLLAADGNIWEGSFRDPSGRLEAWLGCKGLLYVEFTATGARDDLHSMWAGVVPNPAWRLVWALGTLKGPDERIAIPGFYDRVLSPTAEERRVLAGMGFDEDSWREQMGLSSYLLDLTGEDLLAKHLFQPTCNIAGFGSGYTGPGLKTVLPNRASVKMDFRLVPDQDAHEVAAQLRSHLQAQGFDDIEVQVLAAEHPSKTPMDAPIAQTALDAARKLTGKEPLVYPLIPGTGPMYVLCQAHGIPTVSIGGIGDPASNIHAPNESVALDDFVSGIKLIAQIMYDFAG